jgi:N-acetylglucosaminyldiphosphoundecaprenol N-acetyl-beta-D-mannosaminyltransferase
MKYLTMPAKFWRAVKFQLSNVNSENILGTGRGIYLYGDFNVLYHMSVNDILTNDRIIIYPDSTAVHLILKLLGVRSSFICSTDLQEEILIRAVELKKRLYFFGDNNYILKRLQNRLMERFHNIIITGIMDGYNYSEAAICDTINAAESDILFVGLGLTRQENWIVQNYLNLNCPIIIAAGGWFQYLAGNKKRASLLLRNLHLEWLYKLLTEYSRVWKRYLITLPLFFIFIITGKIKLEVRN